MNIFSRQIFGKGKGVVCQNAAYSEFFCKKSKYFSFSKISNTVTLSFFERIQYVKEPADPLGRFQGTKIRLRYAKIQHNN